MVTPWTIKQTQNHLIFGPLSRHISLGYIYLICALIGLVVGFIATSKPLPIYAGSVLDKILFLLPAVWLLRMNRMNQAVQGWLVMKFTLGLCAYLFVIFGLFKLCQNDMAEGLPMLGLGLIWAPGIEFLKSISPYQQFITLTRILLTVPIAWFGISHNHWHL